MMSLYQRKYANWQPTKINKNFEKQMKANVVCRKTAVSHTATEQQHLPTAANKYGQL